LNGGTRRKSNASAIYEKTQEPYKAVEHSFNMQLTKLLNTNDNWETKLFKVVLLISNIYIAYVIYKLSSLTSMHVELALK